MTCEVFVWEMYKSGVGHASMSIKGKAGEAYISWWPAGGTGLKRLGNGAYSHGLVHSMHSDKAEDGVPDWASTPIEGLNEVAILNWWKSKARNVNLKLASEPSVAGNYMFLTANCSTTVLQALRVGATPKQRVRIDSFFQHRAGSMAAGGRFIDRAINLTVGQVGTLGAVSRAFGEAVTGEVRPFFVVAPFDVRAIVEKIWG